MSDPRTIVLGVVAVGLVGVLGLRTLTSDGVVNGDPTGDDPSSVAAVATPLAVGSPRNLSTEQLDKRYAKIRAADPFAKRDFRAKRPTRKSQDTAPQDRRKVEVAAPPPDRLELRLTGLTGRGDRRRAVFENRGERKLIELASGWELEDVSIAAIDTLTVNTVTKGKARTLNLGDTLNVAKSIRDQWVESKASTVSAPSTKAGAAPAESLSDDKRESILERLRKKREASLKKPTSGD